MSDDSLAVLALTNQLVDSGALPLKASELWRLLGRVAEPSRLLGLDERRIAAITDGAGLEPSRLARLLDTGIGLAVRLDALTERGISAVTVLDDSYPLRLRDRLGATAPPVLYCAGNVSILSVDGIGIVGSRDVGPDTVEVTRKVAHQVASARLPLISGAAKGVDRVAMSAAYDGGGTIVGILADSLEREIGRRDTREALLQDRACLCTPYRPDAGFTVGTAMGRNKIIYGLSRVTLVISSADGEGGTWSGATEALTKRYGRVAVWSGNGAGPGNAPLVEAGGARVQQPEAVLELEPIEQAVISTGDQLALSFETSPPAQSSERERG